MRCGIGQFAGFRLVRGWIQITIRRYSLLFIPALPFRPGGPLRLIWMVYKMVIAAAASAALMTFGFGNQLTVCYVFSALAILKFVRHNFNLVTVGLPCSWEAIF